MEQMAVPHTISDRAAEDDNDALDWPMLSPETIRWAIVIGGGVFAASIGALMGGAMSL